ncbi:MAG TPA: zinc-dependent peptidase [Flavobacterium sp.]|jgi:hypothetical protein
MVNNDAPWLSILLMTGIGFLFLFAITRVILEPVYMAVFRKPLFIHFYPLPKKLLPAQKSVLNQKVPFYKRLPPKRQCYFEHRLSSFLGYYDFHVKGGMELTEEMKIMTAATYIMLTFGMRHYLIDTFDKIIFYPDVYHSTITSELHKGEFNPNYKAIVFSWSHFREGYQEGADNLNLGIHEFAHALYFHGMLKRDASAVIFAEMYSRIVEEVVYPANAKKLVDSSYFRIYAYTNRHEFLAVILEHFFETPHLFKSEFPVLYQNVSRMINYDAAAGISY